MRMIHKWSFDGDKSNISKASVLYTGGEKRICDGCDEGTECTTIKTIGGTLIICEDCVRGILESACNPSSGKVIGLKKYCLLSRWILGKEC